MTTAVDLDAYLARVGETELAGSLRPDAAHLFRLHRAHVDTFPYETVTRVVGERSGRAVPELVATMLGARRGGEAPERTALFVAVLEQVGYTVTTWPARVPEVPDPWVPEDHAVLRVRTSEADLLVDVGHGAGPRQPLRLEPGGWQEQDGWTFRIAEHGGRWQVVERWAGDEQVLYDLDPAAATTSARTSAGAEVPGGLVVTQRTAKELRRLVGRDYARVHANGTSTQVHNIDDDLLCEILDEEFGIGLGAEQLDRLLARIDSAEPAQPSTASTG